MQKKLYVHVGMPKTGTTAIQNFCVANSKVLESKGYCYPIFSYKYSGVPAVHNGIFLSRRIYDKNGNRQKEIEDQNFSDNMSLILEKFKKYDNVILSDEGIWRGAKWRKELGASLKQISEENDFQIVIIAYLRRQDEYLSSLWAQNVKIGHFNSSTDTWEEWLARHDGAAVLDYAQRIDEFIELVGRQNVIVRKYDRESFAGGSILADFLAAIGLELDDTFTVEKSDRNISLRGNTVEIKRVLNTIPGLDRKEHIFLKQLLLGYADVSNQEYPCEMFSAEETEQLLKDYQKINSKVAKEFLDEDGNLFKADIKNAEKWEKDNPYMADDIIRFAGMIALHFHEENQKLWDELYKVRHPFRYFISKFKKKSKNKAK